MSARKSSPDTLFSGEDLNFLNRSEATLNFQLSIINYQLKSICNIYKIIIKYLVTKYVAIIMKKFIKRRFFCEKDKKFISLLLAVMLVFSCFTGVAAFTASAEDEVEDVYSVFGSSAEVFGGVWFKENPLTEMTLDESDGLYKITFKDVEPTKMLQLKVLKNHDEDFSWGAPGTDQNYTINVDQKCDVTVTFDPVKELVNVVGDYVTVPQGLQVDHVIAAGNGEDTYLNGAGWDPCDPANAMTGVEPGVWEITMEDIYAFDNYQIKFAANSIDEDGNPVSNPWGINWGTEEEALYPVGEWIDASYNGKNCIFEVEDDESIVRVVLDLRNFDYTTKQGAVFTITVTPPAPVHEHTPGEAVQENFHDADCTHPGSYDSVVYCTTCNAEVSRETVTIKAKGHTEVIDNAVAATCTQSGLTQGSHCSVCSEVIVAQQVIPAKGHATVIDPAVPATCTQSGLTQGSHCSVCNEVIVAQQVVKALGHLERMVPGYAATYTSAGLTDGIFCDRCNEWVVPQVIIPKLKPAHLIGDVNRDGNVNVLDAVLVQKYAASRATLDDEQLYIGDVNDDGEVNVLDAVQIQKFAGERIFEFKKKA